MRRKSTIKLTIVIVTLCPLLCRAVEGTRDSRQADVRLALSVASDLPSDKPDDGDNCCPSDREDHSPRGGDDCCPDGGNNCICSGTVQGEDAHILDHRGWDYFHPFDGFADAGTRVHLHAFVHLTSNGQPAGLAGWGDALSVRAFLQNFRC